MIPNLTSPKVNTAHDRKMTFQTATNSTNVLKGKAEAIGLISLMGDTESVKHHIHFTGHGSQAKCSEQSLAEPTPKACDRPS